MPELELDSLAVSAIRILAASLVMGLPVAWLAGLLDPLLRPRGTPGEAVLVAVCVAVGAGLYGVVSLAFGSHELRALLKLLRRE